MVRLRDLVTAMGATLARIPDLMIALAPEEPIVGYLDLFPVHSSVDKALYQMQPGQVLVLWVESRMDRANMSKWNHVMELHVRAQPDQSFLDLIDAIMAGVPIPGDGGIWRNCPIMPGLLPTEVTEIRRNTDSEGVDYGVIVTETAETGDWPFP